MVNNYHSPNSANQNPGLLRIYNYSAVSRSLEGVRPRVVDIVAETYTDYKQSMAVNPPSQFLTWPDSRNRIIALPAAILSHGNESAGLKWIASFPANLQHGMKRASAVMILNSSTTGLPVALLEGSTISAHRTAASAALATRLITCKKPVSLGIVGAGVIATQTVMYLRDLQLLPRIISVSDPRPLNQTPLSSLGNIDYKQAPLQQALNSELVLLSTTATEPHLPKDFRLQPGQLVLNLSLRDLQPESLLSANNIFDDVTHCLTARTSAHLLSMNQPRESFVTGNLADLIDETVELCPTRGTVFSPFGMGILDLALANHVVRTTPDNDEGVSLINFGYPWTE